MLSGRGADGGLIIKKLEKKRKERRSWRGDGGRGLETGRHCFGRSGKISQVVEKFTKIIRSSLQWGDGTSPSADGKPPWEGRLPGALELTLPVAKYESSSVCLCQFPALHDPQLSDEDNNACPVLPLGLLNLGLLFREYFEPDRQETGKHKAQLCYFPCIFLLSLSVLAAVY